MLCVDSASSEGAAFLFFASHARVVFARLPTITAHKVHRCDLDELHIVLRSALTARAADAERRRNPSERTGDRDREAVLRRLGLEVQDLGASSLRSGGDDDDDDDDEFDEEEEEEEEEGEEQEEDDDDDDDDEFDEEEEEEEEGEEDDEFDEEGEEE